MPFGTARVNDPAQAAVFQEEIVEKPCQEAPGGVDQACMSPEYPENRFRLTSLSPLRL